MRMPIAKHAHTFACMLMLVLASVAMVRAEVDATALSSTGITITGGTIRFAPTIIVETESVALPPPPSDDGQPPPPGPVMCWRARDKGKTNAYSGLRLYNKVPDAPIQSTDIVRLAQTDPTGFVVDPTNIPPSSTNIPFSAIGIGYKNEPFTVFLQQCGSTRRIRIDFPRGTIGDDTDPSTRRSFGIIRKGDGSFSVHARNADACKEAIMTTQQAWPVSNCEFSLETNRLILIGCLNANGDPTDCDPLIRWEMPSSIQKCPNVVCPDAQTEFASAQCTIDCKNPDSRQQFTDCTAVGELQGEHRCTALCPPQPITAEDVPKICGDVTPPPPGECGLGKVCCPADMCGSGACAPGMQCCAVCKKLPPPGECPPDLPTPVANIVASTFKPELIYTSDTGQTTGGFTTLLLYPQHLEDNKKLRVTPLKDGHGLLLVTTLGNQPSKQFLDKPRLIRWVKNEPVEWTKQELYDQALGYRSPCPGNAIMVVCINPALPKGNQVVDCSGVVRVDIVGDDADLCERAKQKCSCSRLCPRPPCEVCVKCTDGGKPVCPEQFILCDWHKGTTERHNVFSFRNHKIADGTTIEGGLLRIHLDALERNQNVKILLRQGSPWGGKVEHLIPVAGQTVKGGRHAIEYVKDCVHAEPFCCLGASTVSVTKTGTDTARIVDPNKDFTREFGPIKHQDAERVVDFACWIEEPNPLRAGDPVTWVPGPCAEAIFCIDIIGLVEEELVRRAQPLRAPPRR